MHIPYLYALNVSRYSRLYFVIQILRRTVSHSIGGFQSLSDSLCIDLDGGTSARYCVGENRRD